MKTLTYSQGQTLPALTKRQVALRNAIGKDAPVKEVEALFAKFEKGVKAQNEWDTQVWGSFSKEQIANMKDIEKSLGIKKGRPMTYEEADRQSANPRHVNEYIADASSRIEEKDIKYLCANMRKDPILKDGAIKVSDKLLNIKYVSIFLK
jgi:hypothetical protein